MRKTPPVYHHKSMEITADRCNPLIQASRSGQVNLHVLARGGYPGIPLETKDLPGLLSVGFWDALKIQDWGLKTHCNEGIELTFLETGRLVFDAENKHTLKPGDMTITRPWQPHSLGNPNVTPSRLHWIILDVGIRKPHQKWHWPKWLILDPVDINELTTLLRQNEYPVWQANSVIEDCFKKIARVLENNTDPLKISRLTILINELFLSLYETLKKQRVKLEPELTSSQRTVELFLESLKTENELLFREWTIKEMADYCHLGVTHFTRLCKKLSNMTPMLYLNHQRIEAAAKMMLKKKELSVTEIAFRSGFNSSQYFATVFKRIKGCSPMKFRTNSVPMEIR